MVVSLPREVLEHLNIQVGTEVEINLDRENRQIILKPIDLPMAVPGVDETFAHQLTEFIEQYRPALKKLAK